MYVCMYVCMYGEDTVGSIYICTCVYVLVGTICIHVEYIFVHIVYVCMYVVCMYVCIVLIDFRIMTLPSLSSRIAGDDVAGCHLWHRQPPHPIPSHARQDTEHGIEGMYVCMYVCKTQFK